MLWALRAFSVTSRIEQTDVAMSIIGSAVKSRDVRNSASRVALPLTNCAVTTAEQRSAVVNERGARFIGTCGRARPRPEPLRRLRKPSYAFLLLPLQRARGSKTPQP